MCACKDGGDCIHLSGINVGFLSLVKIERINDKSNLRLGAWQSVQVGDPILTLGK